MWIVLAVIVLLVLYFYNRSRPAARGTYNDPNVSSSGSIGGGPRAHDDPNFQSSGSIGGSHRLGPMNKRLVDQAILPRMSSRRDLSTTMTILKVAAVSELNRFPLLTGPVSLVPPRLHCQFEPLVRLP